MRKDDINMLRLLNEMSDDLDDPEGEYVDEDNMQLNVVFDYDDLDDLYVLIDRIEKVGTDNGIESDGREGGDGRYCIHFIGNTDDLEELSIAITSSIPEVEFDFGMGPGPDPTDDVIDDDLANVEEELVQLELVIPKTNYAFSKIKSDIIDILHHLSSDDHTLEINNITQDKKQITITIVGPNSKVSGVVFMLKMATNMHFTHQLTKVNTN